MPCASLHDTIQKPEICPFCRCAQLPVEEKLVPLHKNQQRTPDYLAINPLGKVPALQVQRSYVCLWQFTFNLTYMFSFIQPILSRSTEVLCCRTRTASACRRAVPYCGTWHPNTTRQTTGTQARLSLHPNQILQKPSANSEMPPDCMAPENFVVPVKAQRYFGSSILVTCAVWCEKISRSWCAVLQGM